MTLRIPKTAAVVLTAALAIAGSPGRSAGADDQARYEGYAVRFATIAGFPVADLVAGADPSRRIDIAMTVWVLKRPDGRAVLVDSGFHRDRYFREFAVTDYVKPSDAIAALGIKPADVTDI